jgi:hypothetical protein
VRVSNRQSGRGGLRVVLVLVILVAGGYVVWSYVQRQPSGPIVASSQADASSALDKAQQFAAAEARARQTGQPVKVAETFSDAELSALANQAAEAKGLPIDQIGLHATGQGTVQGSAQAHVAGQTVPVTLEGVPVITDNRVALNVTSTRVGSIPLPGPLSDQVTQSIREPLALGQPITGFSNLRVTVADGQTTVSGVAQPS